MINNTYKTMPVHINYPTPICRWSKWGQTVVRLADLEESPMQELQHPLEPR